MLNLNKPVMKEPNKTQQVFLLVALYIVTLTAIQILTNL